MIPTKQKHLSTIVKMTTVQTYAIERLTVLKFTIVQTYVIER
ncbi:hypothetical protein [Brochothrix thermosphacta]|nr:hypothetical protein [Brochothrix thermosphacta]